MTPRTYQQMTKGQLIALHTSKLQGPFYAHLMSMSKSDLIEWVEGKNREVIELDRMSKSALADLIETEDTPYRRQLLRLKKSYLVHYVRTRRTEAEAAKFS